MSQITSPFLDFISVAWVIYGSYSKFLQCVCGSGFYSIIVNTKSLTKPAHDKHPSLKLSLWQKFYLGMSKKLKLN